MKKLLLLLLVGVGIYLGARLYFDWTRPNSDSDTRVSFEIPRGASLSTIADLLVDKELVRDAWTFKVYARRNGLATKFQAGEYIVMRNLTYEEVAEMILTGKSEEIKVTIPEGFTIKQIDEFLAKKNLVKKGDFEQCANRCDLSFRLANLEGYLFPSTYFVNVKNFSAKNFIERLYRNFKIQIQPHQKDIQQSGRTLNEIVIVASMVEREAFGDSLDEKKVIAGVMWKRLDVRMHLGIDATTRYELNEWKRPLYTEDFQRDSLYNTRRSLGLPPTAIANFGMTSFEAAVKPTDTEYYYYLHDTTGQIRFGQTLEDHNRNKAQYLY